METKTFTFEFEIKRETADEPLLSLSANGMQQIQSALSDTFLKAMGEAVIQNHILVRRVKFNITYEVSGPKFFTAS